MSNGTPTGISAIDTSMAHPARRYDYWLGGKDNFAADRESGDAIAEVFPTIRVAARENRAFLRRAVTYLTAEVGIRQFIDLGCGIPTSPNTHEVAQGIAPDTRVVYVDNDALVGAHARALLASHPRGRTAFLHADLRDPDSVLHNPDLFDVLDFDQPIGLLMIAVLHFIPRTPDRDDGDTDYTAARLITDYLDSLAPGSHLALSHATSDHMTPTNARYVTAGLTRDGAAFQLRSREQLHDLLGPHRQLIPPGLASVTDWHPENYPQPDPDATAETVSMWATVARNTDRT
jgi:hypothetical protein